MISLKTTFILIISCFIQDIYAQASSDAKVLVQQTLTIQGFKIILIADSVKHPETKEALKVLMVKLTELEKIIKPKQLLLLKQMPIWIEWEMRKDGAMEYHRSKEWLVSHGYVPDKEKCVEINNIKNFIAWQKLNQPYMVLHELAHSYYDRVLGSDNPNVLAAYQNAVISGKYENVAYNLGGKKRAYALNNAYEYFAELTEAYLGENDFFPFNKSQLKDFDPIGYELMQKTWG
jgi:hypothetical protein